MNCFRGIGEYVITSRFFFARTYKILQSGKACLQELIKNHLFVVLNSSASWQAGCPYHHPHRLSLPCFTGNGYYNREGTDVPVVVQGGPLRGVAAHLPLLSGL